MDRDAAARRGGVASPPPRYRTRRRGPAPKKPFTRYPSRFAAYRLATGHGRCIQGVNGQSTHRGTLCYSFDFKLAVGTPVLAVRGGVVAAVVDHFAGGGAKAHLAPRANFVVVRHRDGSYARYVGRADISPTNRGAAAAATWIFRGDGPRPRRGYSVETTPRLRDADSPRRSGRGRETIHRGDES